MNVHIQFQNWIYPFAIALHVIKWSSKFGSSVQVQISLRDSITQEHDYDAVRYDVIQQIGTETDGNTEELRHSLLDK
jgi:hypothetical protein